MHVQGTNYATKLNWNLASLPFEQIAVVSDIEKAFLQIGLQDDAKDAT